MNFFKKILPNSLSQRLISVKIFFVLTMSYFYDFIRFFKYSSTFKSEYNFYQLEAKIFAHYHVIEKGLSFKNIKPGLAYNLLISLINLLKVYKENKFDLNGRAYLGAISCLKEYFDYHKKINFKLSSDLLDIVQDLDLLSSDGSGGVLYFSKKEIENSSKGDFSILSKNRFSIRDFSSEDIPLDIIMNSISLAQKSPSVCNRQSTRIYVICDEHLKNQVINLNGGARGFGDKANKLIIITSDLSAFDGAGERNQAGIDAGFFSMSLLYALTFNGLGSCTLNWCVDKNKDKKIRKIIKIKKSENINLMVLVGNLPDNFKVARSQRKKIDEIVKVL